MDQWEAPLVVSILGPPSVRVAVGDIGRVCFVVRRPLDWLANLLCLVG